MIQEKRMQLREKLSHKFSFSSAMRILYKDLKGLDVKTQSGTDLGHVFDLTIDPEQHAVIQYHVRALPIAGPVYVINMHQVVSISSEEMIVEDTVTRVQKKEEVSKAPAVDPNPIAMRE